MPIFNVGAAGTTSTGTDVVSNSLRFNSGSSDSITRTFGSTTNRRTYTVSFWLKKADVATEQHPVFAGDLSGAQPYFDFRFDSSQIVNWYHSNSGGAKEFNLKTNAVFRDTNAWYHFVLALDTTQGTASNRVKLYVNGVQITSFSEATYPGQNFDTTFNTNNYEAQFGAIRNNSPTLNGYMAEIVLVDGQQLDPTSFGEFDSDSGIWKPIDVSGLTFGTNGFYLDFEDSGNLGNDANGGTDLTEVNLTAIDQTTDTPTNNFATFNPLSKNDAGTVTFSNGNLTTAHSGTDSRYASYSTIGASTGKWYAEIRIDASSQPDVIIGVGSNIENINRLGTYLGTGSDPTSIGYFSADGEKYINDVSSSYGNSYGNNDIIGVAMDLDNNKLYFSKNGTWQNSGNPESGATGTGALSLTANLTYFIGSAHATTTTRTSTYSANFGNPPFTISSGNTDGNSRGSFEYAPPSGYLSLCTANLSEVLG